MGTCTLLIKLHPSSGLTPARIRRYLAFSPEVIRIFFLAGRFDLALHILVNDEIFGIGRIIDALQPYSSERWIAMHRQSSAYPLFKDCPPGTLRTLAIVRLFSSDELSLRRLLAQTQDNPDIEAITQTFGGWDFEIILAPNRPEATRQALHQLMRACESFLYEIEALPVPSLWLSRLVNAKAG